ncbi:MAG: membrane protein insertase YidC [Balneolaceae bacterium]|nr:membrane protein insertase YidC [Balneolaceae bacterium]
MDRNTVTGLILIFIVMVAWAYVSMPSEEELRQQQAQQMRQDSIAAAQAQQDSAMAAADPDTGEAGGGEQGQGETAGQQQAGGQQAGGQRLGPDQDEPREMGIFSDASAAVGDTTEIHIESPLYRATFTNLGAGPRSLTLLGDNSQTWDHQQIQMIRDTTHSAYSAGFLTTGNYNVETQHLLFEQVTPGDTLVLEEGEEQTLTYALDLSDGRRVEFVYTLRGGTHEMDLDVRFEGLSQNIVGGTVDFGWTSPLAPTERSISQESVYFSAYTYAGEELTQLLLSEAGSREQTINGNIDWVATRTKFFTQIIKPQSPTDGALMIGEVTGVPDAPSTRHNYQSYVTIDLPQEFTAQFQLYAGPMSYYALSSFDDQAYDMVDVGYSWIRWFSDPLVRYVIVPYFYAIDDYMSIGLAIVLFGVLVKVVLFPLTMKSYRSMAAMKELQPKMKEIQEKYKDKPQKQQEATMKLYKEAGVNPLGGCLPNLLQLPILLTLWRFFQNSIIIRQEEFLWATDLSAPDYILSLPLSIPFLGDQLAGFVLLMTVAMFFQSKVMGGMGEMGGGGAMGGQMAALKYIFPVMLLFVFNNFAAGLSLYYLVYNVMSIGQQLIINRQLDAEKANA